MFVDRWEEFCALSVGGLEKCDWDYRIVFEFGFEETRWDLLVELYCVV